MTRNEYVWQRPTWPTFRWDAEALSGPTGDARFRVGRFSGAMAELGFAAQVELRMESRIEEALESSAIEGEYFNRESVRSSVARHLGIAQKSAAPEDMRTEGVVTMMLDATETLATPLTTDRLFAWHAALFPNTPSGLHPIRVAAWRDDSRGPMRVLSGPVGRERVHFEAPPASRIEIEMQRFMAWFNAPSTMDGILRAGLAHLWFLTIHPFDDGNGRIGRAIADRALAQAERSSLRFYSISAQIQRERAAYYHELERTQRGDLDSTRWLRWFVDCVTRAIDGAEHARANVLVKADYWKRFADEPVSPRQRDVLNRILDGFEGKITAKKWAALAKISIPTAQRDINDLLARSMLDREPGGSKNTRYVMPTTPFGSDTARSLHLR